MQPPEPLSGILRRGQARFRVPSLSAAVYRGGETVWTDAVGIAGDAAEATPDTQYRIGSITKTFTAAAVLLLAAEGKLALDDPLARHLPEARFGEATLRRLLAHSSGLQREPPGEVWETLEFPKGDELVARLADAELVLPAGERWHYSNLAYALLGEVVARVAGFPFADFVDERLIRPAGLERTTWRSAEPAARGYFVDPYARTLHAEPTLDGDGVEAVGSLWSTPSDLCAWARHLASIEAMHQVQIMDDPESWTLGHGLGLQLFRRGERVFFGHGGAMPGFLAMLLGRRAEGIGAAVVTNASTPPAAVEEIAGELADRALELYPPDPEPWRPEDDPPPEVAELLGQWWTEGTPFVFWWEGGKLRARP
ncbi:MAG TPA: serine hydrolase domain-containing protein, partial [Gaiellaceae bacterium]|nr:serine hydrolase domain-containing protein [Gaiellaceae bacterium]